MNPPRPSIRAPRHPDRPLEPITNPSHITSYTSTSHHPRAEGGGASASHSHGDPHPEPIQGRRPVVDGIHGVTAAVAGAAGVGPLGAVRRSVVLRVFVCDCGGVRTLRRRHRARASERRHRLSQYTPLLSRDRERAHHPGTRGGKGRGVLSALRDQGRQRRGDRLLPGRRGAAAGARDRLVMG